MSKYIEDLVSIIMPAYNAKDSISKSVESVLRQTYEKWELIIVDDGSLDGTLELVKKKYSDERIKLHQLPYNQGVAAARNFGISVAKGRYLAFLDTDDMWKEQKLEKQINFMINNQYYFTYSAYDMVRNDMIFKTYYVPKKVDFQSQLKGSKIGTLTVMIDRKKIKKIEMKNIGHEDYVTWIKLLKDYGAAYGIQESLAFYDDSNTGLSSNKFKAASWQYKIYRQILGMSFFESVYYFVFYAFNGVKKHL